METSIEGTSGTIGALGCLGEESSAFEVCTWRLQLKSALGVCTCRLDLKSALEVCIRTLLFQVVGGRLEAGVGMRRAQPQKKHKHHVSSGIKSVCCHLGRLFWPLMRYHYQWWLCRTWKYIKVISTSKHRHHQMRLWAGVMNRMRRIRQYAVNIRDQTTFIVQRFALPLDPGNFFCVLLLDPRLFCPTFGSTFLFWMR